MFCPHNAEKRLEGLCKECANIKPYISFRYCAKRCFACKECGYFFGEGAGPALQNKPVVFAAPTPQKKDIVG